jgi:hypothetical protein
VVAETVAIVFDRLVCVFKHEKSREFCHFVFFDKDFFFLFNYTEF